MYTRIVKIVPVSKDGEVGEGLQFGIMDRDNNMIMGGFLNYEDAADELQYRREEDEKIGDFGGDI